MHHIHIYPLGKKNPIYVKHMASAYDRRWDIKFTDLENKTVMNSAEDWDFVTDAKVP